MRTAAVPASACANPSNFGRTNKTDQTGAVSLEAGDYGRAAPLKP
jgi:hypothetical protein